MEGEEGREWEMGEREVDGREGEVEKDKFVLCPHTPAPSYTTLLCI